MFIEAPNKSPSIRKREIKKVKKFENKQAQAEAKIEKNNCPRCFKNAKAGVETHRGGCDVGLKAIFRSIRNLSNTQIATLKKLNHSDTLRDALIEYLMGFDLTRTEAEPVATLICAFDSVQHKGVDIN